MGMCRPGRVEKCRSSHSRNVPPPQATG